MFTENDVRIMLEKMFSEGRRYESAKYQPQSFSEAVKYYSDKIISAQQSVRRTGLCPECGSAILPTQYCMMGHWCGEPPRR